MLRRRELLFAALLLLDLFPGVALAQSDSATADLCTPGFVVGFFNGVWNSPGQAAAGLYRLHTIYKSEVLGGESTQNGSPVYYDLFYNRTGGSGISGLQDVAEVFIQRDAEDKTARAELLSAILFNNQTYIERVRSVLSAAARQTFDDWAAVVDREATATLSSFFSNPPTAGDYARHEASISKLALEGNNLLLVAHSQGNLFVNNAYSRALSIENYTENNIGVVHIAPASSRLNGPHILALNDFVIQGLRLTGPLGVPSHTSTHPISHLLTDASGHTLIASYLNPDLETYGQVVAALRGETARVAQPVQQAITGTFTVTLIWDGAGDVDLHSYEPNGAHVFYADKVGDSGYLDVDNTVSNGPEHYYATCNSDDLAEGAYGIGLNNYRGAEGRRATVQVSTQFEPDIFTRTYPMGRELGDSGNFPAILFSVNVVKSDPATGRLNISVN